jgi:NAD(P)-dependent dehydrogenase (short-subunit alcohol dehydrogenase family)
MASGVAVAARPALSAAYDPHIASEEGTTVSRLGGKVAIVTGAGSGIGRATALRFAAEGAAVVVADINDEGCAETGATIERAGQECCLVHADVREPDSVEQMVATAVDRFGRLDVLHNNAGGSSTQDGPVTEVRLDEWWRTIKIDLFGTFLGCRFAVPVMASRGGGSIINMASIASVVGLRGRDAYSAAKGGIMSLTRSVASNFARVNVRVNAIAPGFVATQRVMAIVGQEGTDAYASEPGVPQLGKPDDIANACVFLASDESRFLTGQVICVDGGMSTVRPIG